ncbi:hypothetical protein EDB89DRAFT_1913493 [Lactarius sanguifluus]|nr:hypothetical protein EDB89DRAFT_1913493 [Lactarius sanguifluus]
MSFTKSFTASFGLLFPAPLLTPLFARPPLPPPLSEPICCTPPFMTRTDPRMPGCYPFDAQTLEWEKKGPLTAMQPRCDHNHLLHRNNLNIITSTAIATTALAIATSSDTVLLLPYTSQHAPADVHKSSPTWRPHESKNSGTCSNNLVEVAAGQCCDDAMKAWGQWQWECGNNDDGTDNDDGMDDDDKTDEPRMTMTRWMTVMGRCSNDDDKGARQAAVMAVKALLY